MQVDERNVQIPTNFHGNKSIIKEKKKYCNWNQNVYKMDFCLSIECCFWNKFNHTKQMNRVSYCWTFDQSPKMEIRPFKIIQNKFLENDFRKKDKKDNIFLFYKNRYAC